MAEPARPAPADDDTTAFIEAVQEGVAAADASHTVPYEAVRRRLLSWGTSDELPSPLPKTR